MLFHGPFIVGGGSSALYVGGLGSTWHWRMQALRVVLEAQRLPPGLLSCLKTALFEVRMARTAGTATCVLRARSDSGSRLGHALEGPFAGEESERKG